MLPITLSTPFQRSQLQIVKCQAISLHQFKLTVLSFEGSALTLVIAKPLLLLAATYL